jgi:hypothetical protein
MTHVALSILLAVGLGAGFSDASATVISTTQQSAIVELRVVLEGPADTVVAHLVLAGEEEVVLPMVARADGSFGVTTELKPANYEVVFETLGAAPLQSAPMTLSALGADLGAVTTTTEPSSSGSAGGGWMWLAVAFGAASLSALAVWALGERDDAKDQHDQDTEPPDSSPAP